MKQGHTRERRRILDHIRLLCACDAGLEAIAAPLCMAVRDFIGAKSGALFWLDAEGNPAGFFHDCAPAELKDFFITRLEELFSSLDEPNMVSHMALVEPSIGQALSEAYLERFWSSNVYRYLCVPLGHRYLIDMRIDVRGAGRAVFFFYNPADRPFTQADATSLQPVQHLIQRAAASNGDSAKWQVMSDGTAHLVTDIAAERIHTINAAAEALLMSSHLLQQRIAMTQPPRIVPGFVKQLAQMLATNPVLHVPVNSGRIVAKASLTRALGQGVDDRALMFVALELQVAVDVLLIEHVMALPLTAFQRDIALYAMQGGHRADCEAEFGVGAEALKKHLRAIFVATGASKWIDLETIAATVLRDQRAAATSGQQSPRQALTSA